MACASTQYGGKPQRGYSSVFASNSLPVILETKLVFPLLAHGKCTALTNVSCFGMIPDCISTKLQTYCLHFLVLLDFLCGLM